MVKEVTKFIGVYGKEYDLKEVTTGEETIVFRSKAIS